MKIRVGTRGSRLALIQTEIFIAKLISYFPYVKYDIIPITTTGDNITNKNLYNIGGKALFLKEIEEQLLGEKIDIAVHSLKDVPGVINKQLKIAAVLERSDPRDCFLSLKHKSIQELPQGAVIGTSSVRRKVIIQKIRPDLRFVPFRGNINTRLKKLKNEKVDATILALAGLDRADLFDASFCYPLTIKEMLPASGQGTISLQIKSNNQSMQKICDIVNHQPTWYLSQAERSFMTYLDSSCRTPMSAHAYYEEGKINANYMLSNLEGTSIHYITKLCSINSVDQVGISAAKEMLLQVNKY